jgi:hypothetical protein
VTVLLAHRMLTVVVLRAMTMHASARDKARTRSMVS